NKVGTTVTSYSSASFTFSSISICKMLGAVLEKVAPEYDFDILKIDIDENVKLAEEYEVTVVPTLLFVKDGKIIHRESGFFSKDKFKSLIDVYLK
ncbi:thioredoxin domain-containing protein, partial [Enterococcus faecalis]|uniref:thioredoxin family protein n=1 Tax=Enterococcus faecalis TaxID=1351 RepID=UPI002CCD5659